MGLARAAPGTDAAVSVTGRLSCFLARTENKQVISTGHTISGAHGCFKETRWGEVRHGGQGVISWDQGRQLSRVLN